MPLWRTRPAGSARSSAGKPLRWVGVRSYGIYLWHFPIIVLTTPGGIANGEEPLRELLQVAAIFVIAALSWKYVEEPIRHGALGRLLAAVPGAAAGGRPPISPEGWAGRRGASASS